MNGYTSVGAALGLNYTTGYSSGATNYLALLTAAPNALSTPGTMTELTSAGYPRQTMAGTNWTEATGYPASTSNVASIVFGPFTAATPLIGWICLLTSSSGTTGNILMAWTMNDPTAYSVNQSVSIPAKMLIMTQG